MPTVVIVSLPGRVPADPQLLDALVGPACAVDPELLERVYLDLDDH